MAHARERSVMDVIPLMLVLAAARAITFVSRSFDEGFVELL
jgi:hypothetical protein